MYSNQFLKVKKNSAFTLDCFLHILLFLLFLLLFTYICFFLLLLLIYYYRVPKVLGGEMVRCCSAARKMAAHDGGEFKQVHSVRCIICSLLVDRLPLSGPCNRKLNVEHITAYRMEEKVFDWRKFELIVFIGFLLLLVF